TLYGALSAYAGGRVDALMMRIVDILYGLPYILLVVLLAVAADAVLDDFISRPEANRRAWIQRQALVAAADRGRPATAEGAAEVLAADASLRERLTEQAAALFPSRD